MQLRRPDLARRLPIAALLVCSFVYVTRSSLMDLVLPGLREVVELSNPQFTLFGLQVASDGGQELLRLRANLTVPIQVAERTVYPVAWPYPQRGGYEVTMTLGAVLSPALALLIAAAAWPLRSKREGGVRAVAAIALSLLVTIANAAAILHADLLHVAVDAAYDNESSVPSAAMMASRLLMDGGGFAIAIGLALGAVAFASRLAASGVMRHR
jgi:hypothetical protein